MNKRDPLVLTELEQTCGMYPSQWEGKTTDGRFVYIRYRHGELSVGVGVDQDDAVYSSAGWDGKEPWLCVEPDGMDSEGIMDTDTMLRLTGITLAEGASRP